MQNTLDVTPEIAKWPRLYFTSYEFPCYVHVVDVTFFLSDAPPGMDKEKKVEEGNKEEGEGEDKKPKEEEDEKTKEEKVSEEGGEASKKTEGDEENDKKEEKEGDAEKKPRPLHKVTSIFLR